MAIRQYIGARYVIKIYENSQNPNSAEWEPGVEFEPLTMVTFNNNSYISRKRVPTTVGNPTTAPVYWAQTGYYNGQIAALQNEIDAISALTDEMFEKFGDGVNYDINTVMVNYPNDTYTTTISGDANYKNLQGVTFNNNARVYAMVILKDNTDGMIVIVDEDLTTVINRKTYTNTIGHGNQICYNPATDRYLLCPSGPESDILEIDANTLSVVARHEPIGYHNDQAERLAGITYDADNDVYYCSTWNGIYKFDSSFTEIDYYAIPYMDYLKDIPLGATTYPNGFVFYKDKLYMAISTSFNSSYFDFIVCLNLDGTLNNRMNICNESLWCEIESLTVIDNTIRSFSVGYGVIVADLYLYNQPSGVITNKFGTPGEVLPTGADFNDYKKVGKYSIPSNTMLLSMSNAPVLNASGAMYVVPLGGMLKQIVISSAGSKSVIASRRYNQGNNTWDNWEYINDVLVKGRSKTISGNFPGIVTSGGTVFAFDIPIKALGTPSITFSAANIRAVTGYVQFSGSNSFASNDPDIASITTEVHADTMSVLITSVNVYANNNTPIVFSGEITVTMI